MTDPADRPRATLWQRRSAKKLARFARKNPGQPLEPGDWESYFPAWQRAPARPPGRLEQLDLRGKDELVSAYRLSV